MQVGFIGAGNMAAALARGWGEPVLVHRLRLRPGGARWSTELGGEVVASNRELRRAAPTSSCSPTSPPARRRSPAEAAPAAGAASCRLAARRHDAVAQRARAPTRARDRGPRASRTRRSRCAAACSLLRRARREPSRYARERARSCSAASARVIEVPERLIDVAGACSGVGPAYWALLAEAWVEAGDPPRHAGARSRRAGDRDDGRQPPRCCAPAATTRSRCGAR